MSKTIEEIRAIVATDQGYDSWEDFLEWEDADDVAYHLAIEYSNQQTQELLEQNAELVSALKKILDFKKFQREEDFISIKEMEELLTKYNHLNQM